MQRLWLLLAMLILLTVPAVAQFNFCGVGFCNIKTGAVTPPPPPPTGFLCDEGSGLCNGTAGYLLDGSGGKLTF